MSAQAPATIENDIIDGVNALINAPHYIDAASDMRYHLLLREVKKLANVGGAELHLCSAYLKHAAGDIDPVRHHLENARRMKADAFGVLEIETNCLSNLGYFSESKRAYVKLVNPTNGNFTRLHYLAGVLGAFRAIRDFAVEAQKMNIDLSTLKHLESFSRASAVLDKTRTEECEVDALLDLAGEVMREHRLFFMGLEPALTIIDDDALDCCVFVKYTLGVSHSEAADLMLEVAGRAADRLPRFPPGFSVGFKGMHA